MKANRKYLVAVALFAVLAVVFGLAGTGARVSPRQSLTSDSTTHFTNPPTYDSGWVNITDKCGQDFTLVHNLNTTDITVDITGRTAILTEENWDQFWGMGDVNRDGYIDEVDTNLILDAFGSSPGDPNWNPDADLNEDGEVDIYDATICAGNQGFSIWTYFGAGTHQRHFGGTCLAPGWSQTYSSPTWEDDEIAYSMVQTADGGYAIAGYTAPLTPPWNYDLLLVKTDSTGTMLWNKTYGGPDDDKARSVVQTLDGGYALAGETSSFGAGGDFWLVKTDATGNVQWNKTYGGPDPEVAYSVVQTADGGYAMAGERNLWPNRDFYLVKTDSDGNHLWNQTYGGVDVEVAYSMVQTFDGGYAMAGLTGPPPIADPCDLLLVKTNSTGTMLWNKTYGGPDFDSAWSVVQTLDGGYALAGETSSFGAGGDFWLVKTDATGNVQWNKTYGGPDYEHAYSVIQTSDGGYALAGRTHSFGAGGVFWLVKTDATGNVQWNKTYGGFSPDCARSVVQTSDGGYAIAGYTEVYSSPPARVVDFRLVKTDVEMGLAWTGSTNNTIILYRGRTDAYWNFVRVRIWTIKEPTWQYGDIDMDGDVDYDDFIVLAGNYGKTYSALSLGGIAAVAGLYMYKKRKQPK